jgi:hypothetical protein
MDINIEIVEILIKVKCIGHSRLPSPLEPKKIEKWHEQIQEQKSRMIEISNPNRCEI